MGVICKLTQYTNGVQQQTKTRHLTLGEFARAVAAAERGKDTMLSWNGDTVTIEYYNKEIGCGSHEVYSL